MPRAASECEPPGFTLGEIAAALSAELLGDAGSRVTRIGALGTADPATISFLAQERYLSLLSTTRACCVIVAPAHAEAAAARGAVLVSDAPYLAYARLSRWWAERTRPQMPATIHPSAVIDPAASLAEGVAIGPLAVVEAGATIARGAVVGARCVVGADASIGASTHLAPGVVIGRGCSIGARCLVHSGVVIGADGFGFAPNAGTWEKIEQLGNVRIGDDCEIGANTCIDRGALDDTVIGCGVKIDNLVQIAHNVRIGDHTAIAGNAGVAGSAVIGSRCTIGGGAGVAGHLTLADDVHVSAMSLVSRSLRKPGVYTGAFPIDENAAWEKNAATLRHLHALRDRVRRLEKTACQPEEPQS